MLSNKHQKYLISRQTQVLENGNFMNDKHMYFDGPHRYLLQSVCIVAQNST